MKTLLLTFYLLPFTFCISHAQLYNDAATTNDGNLMSDYSNQWYNTASGSYTGKNAAVFEHYGPATSTFVNNGSYTYGTGGMSDKFLGPNGAAGTQEIGGITRTAFYDLVFNNGSTSTINITNTQGISIANSLVFSNGITSTVRSQAGAGAISLSGGAIYSGTMGATRHVNGYVDKVGSSSFTFPVGNGVQYRPLAYISGPGSSDELAVAYFTGDPGANLDPTGGPHSRAALNPAGTAGTTKLASVSPVGFWDWMPVSGIATVSFTVSIPDMSGGGGYPTGSELRVVGWNTTNSRWDNLSGATSGSSNVAGTLLSGTVSNMSNYSAIGIGSVNSNVPLPLKLISFSGLANGCSVNLQWQTVNEKDADYFQLERSPDAVIWIAIHRISAANQGVSVLNYVAKDETPKKESNYYRLKMVDMDGSFTYSPIVRVTPDCGGAPGIRVWPNPFSESLLIDGMAPGTIIRISNAEGREMYSGMADDQATVRAGSWPAGVYTVRVTRGTKEVSTMQVVKKQ